jgi:hypothetical protein
MDVSTQEFGSANWDGCCSPFGVPTFQFTGGRCALAALVLKWSFSYGLASFFHCSFFQYNVEKIVGTGGAGHAVSKATHYALYGFMTVMPASGIAMGYYGGKGLPFFYTTIPGVVTTAENKANNGNIAKNVSVHPASSDRSEFFYQRSLTIFSL